MSVTPISVMSFGIGGVDAANLMSAVRHLGVGLLVAVGVLAASTMPGFADTSSEHAPQPDPVLRLEAGAHLSVITRASVDRAGMWLLTASEDKTARLWELATGKLLGVLRPPIGPGSEGALYAAALSPDGRVAAVGGNTASEEGEGHTLYLFDTDSALLPPKRSLRGLEAPITQLAWSPDGRYLAVGLRQAGLRVFDRNLQFIGADPEYNDAIYGAEFGPHQMLATASLDGSLRLYRVEQDGLVRIARKRQPEGRPYGVAIAPGGETLAVGYADRPQVDLLSIAKLELARRIQVDAQGNLGRVAWSGQGDALYAAGTASRQDGRFPVYRVGNSGRSKPEVIGTRSNTILGLASIGNELVVTSAEPSWFLLDTEGREKTGSRSAQIDFRDIGAAFRASPDGMIVAIPSATGTDERRVFDLELGELRTAHDADRLRPPSQSGRGVPKLSGWKNDHDPKLDGKPLTLANGERARSATLVSDHGPVLLGTDWFFRAYDRKGKPLWTQRTPGAVWAVNASRDGRWGIVALGDGTIRWYDLNDGNEVLALFVHADRGRWIAWTPAGHYDTSPGGEDLIGWHLNRAPNQAADFFSVGRFRERFYQPQRVRAALAPVTTPGAVPTSTIAARLPPVLELRSERLIESAANNLPIRFSVRSAADAPVSEVRVRVNDKLYRTLDAAALGGKRGPIQEIEIDLPPENAEIRLFAVNRFGKSDPLLVQVRRPPAPESPGVRFERLYLLVIGISKYPGDWELGLADKDARDFATHMTRQQGELYGEFVPRLLVNGDATRETILGGLQWLREQVGPRDAGMVFLAGHGDTVGTAYYFIPADPQALPPMSQFQDEAQFDAWKAEHAPKLWISGDEISRTLLGLKGRAVFFVDTCHSGVTARPGQSTNPDLTRALNQINEERGVIVFASSAGRELSQENLSWGNGAFTKAIIEGVRGKADLKNDGLIRPTLLQSYVTDRVKELTRTKQRPVMFNVGFDDPIAVRSQ